MISKYENNYYISVRYKINNGTIVNFLGVKYSFLGCISAKIAYTLCKYGVKEIIYVGKLGTFGSNEDLYNKIFSPTNYLIMYYDKVIKTVNNLQNNFAKQYGKYDTKTHVSVPTVLEEDLKQGRKARLLKTKSIDNEISQIAYAIDEYNKEQKTNISFAPIHFATDYIREAKDHKKSEIIYGLHNNRSSELLIRKQRILNTISEELWHYLNI